MMITVISSAVFVASCLVILANTKSLADDTLTALRDAARHIRAQGTVVSNVACGLLWLTIFGLGFL